MFTAIDHPAIACRDVTRQIAWYCRVLGMRIIADNGKEPPAVIVGYGDNTREGAMIELMPVRDDGPEPASLPRFCPGLRHLALRVSDFEGACAKLNASGVKFITEVGTAVGGGKVASFRDPEGNELQIVER